MKNNHRSAICPVHNRVGALALAVLLCLIATRARADVNPEPAKPTGPLVELFAKLYSNDVEVSSKARDELWETAQRKNLPIITRVARRGREKERLEALNLLSKFFPKDLSKDELDHLIVPAILKGMESRYVSLRSSAAISAVRYATHSKALVDGLISLLDDKEEVHGSLVCHMALASLSQVSRSDDRILPLMWKHAMKGHLRHQALQYMGTLGYFDGRAVYKVLPLLATVLNNPKEEITIRQAAARGIWSLGGRGEPAYAAVVQTFRKPGLTHARNTAFIKHSCLLIIHRACAGTSAEKGKPELFKHFVPDLIRVVETEVAECKGDYQRSLVLGDALGALEGMGPLAKAALPALRKVLKELPSSPLQFNVKRIIERIEKK